MTLLLLEALGAGLLLVGIIWWTMFSGRKNGELSDPDRGPGAVIPPVETRAEPSSTKKD